MNNRIPLYKYFTISNCPFKICYKTISSPNWRQQFIAKLRGKMIANTSRRLGGAALIVGGAMIFKSMITIPTSNDSTNGKITEILATVKAIEADLGIGKVSSASVDPVANFPVITSKHKSLTAKALRENPELYTKLCNRKTPMGFTFDQAIQAGIDAPHLGVGIVAGEAAAFETFKEIMDPVIEGWHGYKPTDTHTSDMDYTKLKMTAEQAAKFDKYVISTRIRGGRAIDGFALPPSTDRAQRRRVEALIAGALASMPSDLAGKYYPLGKMTKEEEQQLIDDHFLFQKPGPRNVLANCGAARDWPDARGIFHNKDKTFLVWVNEEDHMRCISMNNGGNVKEVFALFARAINEIEKSLGASGNKYAYNDHLVIYKTACYMVLNFL